MLQEFEQNYKVITTLPDLIEFADNFKYRRFGYDTETTALEYDILELVGIGIYADIPVFIQFNFKGFYYEAVKDPNNKRKKIKVKRWFTYRDGIDWEQAKPYIEKIFKDAEVICANGKFDIKVAQKYGFNNFNLVGDTQAQLYIIDSSQPTDLKSNVTKYLGIDMTKFGALRGVEKITLEGKSTLNMVWSKVDFPQFQRYGALDPYVTYLLHEHLQKVLDKTGKSKHRKLPSADVRNCYENIELRLIPCTAAMEYEGIYIDRQQLKKLNKKALKEIAKVEEELYNLAGIRFNLNSPKQLEQILFDRLNLDVISKTAKGARATNVDTLKELAYRGSEFAEKLLEYRSLEKLNSTYLEKLPNSIDSDGKIRANFNQMFTSTGRFCVSPDTLIETNLGLIPIGDVIPDELGVIEITGLEALTHKGRFKPVTHAINKGYEEMYEVTTESGKIIKCTLGHKFLTNLGWKSLENIVSLQAENTSINLIIYEDDGKI